MFQLQDGQLTNTFKMILTNRVQAKRVEGWIFQSLARLGSTQPPNRLNQLRQPPKPHHPFRIVRWSLSQQLVKIFLSTQTKFLCNFCLMVTSVRNIFFWTVLVQLSLQNWYKSLNQLVKLYLFNVWTSMNGSPEKKITCKKYSSRPHNYFVTHKCKD